MKICWLNFSGAYIQMVFRIVYLSTTFVNRWKGGGKLLAPKSLRTIRHHCGSHCREYYPHAIIGLDFNVGAYYRSKTIKTTYAICLYGWCKRAYNAFSRKIRGSQFASFDNETDAAKSFARKTKTASDARRAGRLNEM